MELLGIGKVVALEPAPLIQVQALLELVEQYIILEERIILQDAGELHEV